MTTEHRFQVNLAGIIELLSDHLYSGPQVFVRELLQNGVDAISARRQIAANHAGELSLELIDGRDGSPPTLVFEDNGIGLTEEEIHRFISTIGSSSKRTGQGFEVLRPDDFIGQFGIGLLSCFVVCDQIVMVTRSARDTGAGTWEWRGRNDGTYEIRRLERDIEPGTRVYLRAKAGTFEYFEKDRLCGLVQHFGGLLPTPIWFVNSQGIRKQLNKDGAPWRGTYASADERDAAVLEWGAERFNMRFPAYIPLESGPGGVDGVAFIMPVSTSAQARQPHRVYLKNMLLSEKADNLLPEWAFFVRCAVNAHSLRPTASRESFYEDDTLASARKQLGQCIRDYLVRLSETAPDDLATLIAMHHRAIKSLAVADDEFFRVIGDWLPFRTSHGLMTLGDLRSEGHVRFTHTVDDFRQVSSVAAAEGMFLVNAGYEYDADLIEKGAEVYDDLTVEPVSASELMHTFDDLSLADQERTAHFLEVADRVLAEFRVGAELKNFAPTDLPALYSINAEGRFRRAAEQSKEVANEHWAGILDSLTRQPMPANMAELCFNYANPLVRKLTRLHDGARLELAIGMLYVQAMLFAHQPLRMGEMRLLNSGLIGLIELGLPDDED